MNDERHGVNLPEVTLLIKVKHLPQSKCFQELRDTTVQLFTTAMIAWNMCKSVPYCG